MAIPVTAVFILTTLGLFEFTAVQVPNSNQCRLAETGSSQRQLSKLDGFGTTSFLTPGVSKMTLQHDQDGVIHYIKVDSNDDYRLSFTTNPDEKATFTTRRQGVDDNKFDVFYYPEDDIELCLQGVFPSVNGTVDYTQAYPRVGNCKDHYNIGGGVVHLTALTVSKEMNC